MTGIVSLNVGGRVFQTTVSTLKQFPNSFLGCMFADSQSLKPSVKDKDGNWFIDRSYEHFDEILEIYRNGRISDDAVGRLRKEIKFYFPGHLSLTERQTNAKKYAKRMFKYWKARSKQADEVSEFIVPEVSEYMSCDSIKRLHKASGEKDRDYAALMMKSILGKESNGAKKDIDTIFKNPGLRQELKEQCTKLHELTKDFTKDFFLEYTCNYLQNMIGQEYVVEWKRRSHQCKGNDDCIWGNVVLSGRGIYDYTPEYKLPATLFKGVLDKRISSSSWSDDICFPPIYCSYKSSGCDETPFPCTFIYIHPRLKYSVDSKPENLIIEEQVNLRERTKKRKIVTKMSYE